MKPWSTGRAYLNFIGDEGAARVEAAFGPEKYARLQALKDEVGPGQPLPPQPEHPAERERDVTSRLDARADRCGRLCRRCRVRGTHRRAAVTKRGRSVVVLEARDRVGGRIWTQQLADGRRSTAAAGGSAPKHDAIFGLAARSACPRTRRGSRARTSSSTTDARAVHRA